MGIYLGIDVGGSKTHALLVDEQGTVLGFGKTGPGNHESVGYEGLLQAMQSALHQALTQNGVTKNQISGAGFGIAGYDWPSERTDTLQVINNLGLNCPLEFVNDAVLGLYAGSERGWGVNLIAGTSNNCYGRSLDGREGRITGAGMLFGEFGGALEIVVKAIQAINYQWIQRGPPTTLSKHLMDQTNTPNVQSLIENLATGILPINPAWAQEVFTCAQAGDTIAQEIIRWAAEELAELARAVIRQLAFEQTAFDLILSGSLFQKESLLIEPVRKSVIALAPDAKLSMLKVPPVTGAALLGMRAAGLSMEKMYKNVALHMIKLEE